MKNQLFTKTILALILGAVAGLIASLVNGTSLVDALLRAVAFGILVAAIVACLAWASNTAEQKGYPSWLGFWLVVILNLLGPIIVWLLPERKSLNAA